MLLGRRDSWLDLDFGSEEDFPPLWRACNIGEYWFCENINGEMFFRSKNGKWFVEDPTRKRFFIESDEFLQPEFHYGDFYGREFRHKLENVPERFDNTGQHSQDIVAENFPVEQNPENLMQYEPWLKIHSQIKNEHNESVIRKTNSCPGLVSLVKGCVSEDEHKTVYPEFMTQADLSPQKGIDYEKIQYVFSKVVHCLKLFARFSFFGIASLLTLPNFSSPPFSRSDLFIANNNIQVEEQKKEMKSSELQLSTDFSEVCTASFDNHLETRHLESTQETTYLDYKSISKTKDSISTLAECGWEVQSAEVYKRQVECPVMAPSTDIFFSNVYNKPSFKIQVEQEPVLKAQPIKSPEVDAVNEEYGTINQSNGGPGVENQTENSVPTTDHNETEQCSWVLVNEEDMENENNNDCTIPRWFSESNIVSAVDFNETNEKELIHQVQFPKTDTVRNANGVGSATVDEKIGNNLPFQIHAQKESVPMTEHQVEEYSVLQELRTQPLGETHDETEQNNYPIIRSDNWNFENNDHTLSSNYSDWEVLGEEEEDAKLISDRQQVFSYLEEEEIQLVLDDNTDKHVPVEEMIFCQLTPHIHNEQDPVQTAHVMRMPNICFHDREEVSLLRISTIGICSDCSVVSAEHRHERTDHISEDNSFNKNLKRPLSNDHSFDHEVPSFEPLNQDLDDGHADESNLVPTVHPTEPISRREEIAKQGEEKTDEPEYLLDIHINQVFAELKTVCQQPDNTFLQTFPWVEKFKQKKSSLFFEFEFNVETANSAPELKSGFIKDLCEILRPSSRVLITGPPGFGKTTLCSLLHMSCARKIKYLKAFEICLKFHFTESTFNCSDISESIVESFQTALFSRDSEVIRRALQSNSSKILLLFDGFDEISIQQQRSVMRFLESDQVFKNASILLTARPDYREASSKKWYSQKVIINGLSYDRFLYLVNKLEKASGKKRKFKMFENCKKLDYLSELSPLFACFACHFCEYECCQTLKEENLYDLLKNVVYDVISFKMEGHKKTFDINKLMRKVGRFFYRALVEGKRTFEQPLVYKCFKSCCDLLLSSQILCEERIYGDSFKCYTSSSKVLMVFFATFYLRHKWERGRKNEKRKRKFIQKYICASDCSADYVIGDSENPFVYLVGLLPEIVIRCSVKGKDETVEMYYDVERMENSQAFDSVNLLCRISKHRLDRFGFEEITEEDDIYNVQDSFESVLNLLNFDSGTVDFKFYFNVFEEKHFLKINGNNTEENDVTFQAVYRTNRVNQVEKMYIDFRHAFLTQTFQFLLGTVSTFLPDFTMDLSAIKLDAGAFFFNLSTSIVRCGVQQLILLSVFESARSPSIGHNCSLSIQPQTKTVTFTSLSSVHGYNTISYDTEIFSTCEEEITNNIRDVFRNCLDISFSISI